MADLPDFQAQEAAQILLLVHADGLMTGIYSEDLLDEDEIERDRELTVKPRLAWRWRASKAKRRGQRRESKDKKLDFLPSSRASVNCLIRQTLTNQPSTIRYFRTRDSSIADARPCSNPDRVHGR